MCQKTFGDPSPHLIATLMFPISQLGYHLLRNHTSCSLFAPNVLNHNFELRMRHTCASGTDSEYLLFEGGGNGYYEYILNIINPCSDTYTNGSKFQVPISSRSHFVTKLR